MSLKFVKLCHDLATHFVALKLHKISKASPKDTIIDTISEQLPAKKKNNKILFSSKIGNFLFPLLKCDLIFKAK